MKEEVKHVLDESSNIGVIRRSVNFKAMDLGFNEVRLGQISIVVNELCTNILKHAVRGEIIVVKNESSISLLAIDKGPGISNIVDCIKDGYSTSGTAGTGLGAIKRLASRFDFYTQPGKGTVVMAAFDAENAKVSKFLCNGFSLPIKGEVVSGDNWSFKSDDESGKYQILLADGLGHGIYAHEASRAAVNEFLRYGHENPLIAVTNIHRYLKDTRGAAVAVAFCAPDEKKLEYCGLGNISGSLVTFNSSKELISYNGTAGIALTKTQSLPYQMNKEAILIMHSDGLGTQWNLADYSGLLIKDPLIIAGVLYRDYVRRADDVTVIVAKVNV